MQEEIKQIGEYQMIKSKRIIGMTSTGAARCNALVHLLQTPIGKYIKHPPGKQLCCENNNEVGK